MNHPQIFNLVLIACPILMIFCSGVCLMLLRRARRETRDCLELATQLSTELAETSRDMDTITCRVTGYSRRIAWLESRMRNNSTPTAAKVEEAPAQASGKPTITERRHRVTQLAERGVDCNTIASMLNMPHGEVELMVGLSHVN